MSRSLTLPMVLAGALSAVAACGRDAPRPAAAASNRPTPAGARANTGNACDRKLLTPADVSGLLAETITGIESVPGDPQSCKFATASFPSVTVSLRPGLGRTTVQTWLSGKMPIGGVPVAGVGDEAAWVDDLTEVIAEKGDLLCDVQMDGLPRSLRSPAARAKAIGALCNKIFSEAR